MPRVEIALGLLFGGVVAITAAVGIPLAYRQLKQSRQAAQVAAIGTIWQWFDDEQYRSMRKQIHDAHKDGFLELGTTVAPELKEVIQRVATSMDRVGLFLVNGLIEERYIFERYSEVVITMWRLTGWVLDDVRRAKGGGWRYFGPYPLDMRDKVRRPNPDLLPRIRARLLGARPENLYDAALAYKSRHEPGAEYKSVSLEGAERR